MQATKQDKVEHVQKMWTRAYSLREVISEAAIGMYYVCGLHPALQKPVRLYSCDHMNADLEALSVYSNVTGVNLELERTAPSLGLRTIPKRFRSATIRALSARLRHAMTRHDTDSKRSRRTRFYLSTDNVA